MGIEEVDWERILRQCETLYLAPQGTSCQPDHDDHDDDDEDGEDGDDGEDGGDD